MAEHEDLKGEPFDRSTFERFLKHPLFYTKSFKIYQTTASGSEETIEVSVFLAPCALSCSVVALE